MKQTASSATTTQTQAMCTFKSVDLTLHLLSNDEDDDNASVTKDVKPSLLLQDTHNNPLCTTNSIRGRQLANTEWGATLICDTANLSNLTTNAEQPTNPLIHTEEQLLPPLKLDASATKEPCWLSGTKQKRLTR